MESLNAYLTISYNFKKQKMQIKLNTSTLSCLSQPIRQRYSRCYVIRKVNMYEIIIFESRIAKTNFIAVQFFNYWYYSKQVKYDTLILVQDKSY